MIGEHSEMVVEVSKSDALVTLRKNREQHLKIVKEARDGYLKQAQAAIEKRLGQLREGKIVVLHFGLSVPEDHTQEYDTAIRMLELHQRETVSMSATQVQTLMMDQWSWQHRFLMTNSSYSQTASAMVGATENSE